MTIEMNENKTDGFFLGFFLLNIIYFIHYFNEDEYRKWIWYSGKEESEQNRQGGEETNWDEWRKLQVLYREIKRDGEMPEKERDGRRGVIKEEWEFRMELRIDDNDQMITMINSWKKNSPFKGRNDWERGEIKHLVIISFSPQKDSFIKPLSKKN